MKTCKKCGHQNSDDQNLCAKCNASLTPSSMKNDMEQFHKEIQEREDRINVLLKPTTLDIIFAWGTLLFVIVQIASCFIVKEAPFTIIAILWVIFSTLTAIYLLFPKAFWNLRTSCFSFFYNGDIEPTEWGQKISRFLAYLLIIIEIFSFIAIYQLFA